MSAIHGWKKTENVQCDTVVLMLFWLPSASLCIVLMGLKILKPGWSGCCAPGKGHCWACCMWSCEEDVHLGSRHGCDWGQVWQRVWAWRIVANCRGWINKNIQKQMKKWREQDYSRTRIPKPVQSFKRTCKINHGFCLPNLTDLTVEWLESLELEAYRQNMLTKLLLKTLYALLDVR